MLVVLANRRTRNSHHKFRVILKEILPMILAVIGLSFITAIVQGGGSMIGSFAMNLAAHVAIKAVRG